MTTRRNKGRSAGKRAAPKTTKPDSKRSRNPKQDVQRPLPKITPARRCIKVDQSARAQQKRVLEYLQASPQPTYSLRAHGISHPAQRIRELIALGYCITSHRVAAVDSDGFMHRNVAMYTLVGGLDTRDLFDLEASACQSA